MAILEANKRMHEEASHSSKHKKQDKSERRQPPPRSIMQKSFGDDQDVDLGLRVSGELKKDSVGNFRIYRHKYSGRLRDPKSDQAHLYFAIQQHKGNLDEMEDADSQKKMKLDIESFAKVLRLDERSAKLLAENLKEMEKGFHGVGVDQIIAFHRMNYKNYVASTLR